MAKYDHGGGCACGLSRFCDCSQATEQDRKDREAYDRQFGKKEAWKRPLKAARDMVMKENPPMALDQREDLYRETNFAGDARAAFASNKVRGTRLFDTTMTGDSECIAFVTITGGSITEDIASGKRRVDFVVDNDMQRDYLVNVWKPGMPREPGPATAKIEFDYGDLTFLSALVDGFVTTVQTAFPGMSLPGVAQDVQRKLKKFKSALE